MRKLLIMSTFIALMGCDHFDSDKEYVTRQTEEDADQVASNIERDTVDVATQARQNLKTTGEQLRTWLITPNPPKKSDQPIASSYCYRSLQDVLCYRQPMPGWEHRLVAYQGTGATPPDAAQTKPLPKRMADASVLPENKVANAKPVFKELPAPPKPEEKNTDVPPVLDAAHEQLPNPLYSPQL